ncbi:TonB-dependent receptor [Sandaracinobacteroides saxicola]|uniref:TonB-dependent receptor n=1 Tax=Sandaracinobacteroides saxicola TaxID=2759707 RepID=A0A7G5IFQ7_9SPHN|nr:TonB-dependent receptor [Sandaracinobacteroides saxicola]QMW22199.1 TonB-dependent receptor [Sandaracinobacteroides saxicola]
MTIFFTHRAALRVAVSTLALSAGAPLLAQAAAAADETQEIIVTATKRASTLQEVPFSINALTAADLQRSGASTIEDVARNVAGLTIQNLGPGQSQVSVRGVSAGQIVRDQPGVKEQVGIYLDESAVSLSLFTPDLDFYDLNRVETLRGPQGTLFGSGSVGGTLRYITNAPTTRGVEGSVEGNINMVAEDAIGGSVKGAVNAPLGDAAAVRAVGYWTRYGGFIDAYRPGGTIDKNVNSGERYGGRLAVLLQPSEAISLTPRIVYQKVKANGFNRQEVFNLYGNPFTTTRPAITFKEREQYLLLREAFEDKFLLADLNASVDLGGVSLTSVSSYVDRDILVSRDASALTGSVTIDLAYQAPAALIPSNLNDSTKLKQFTQEVRLSSTGEGPFQWVIGGFYSDIKRDYAQRLPTPGYDVFTDIRFGAGTSAAVANGFPLNSPYNADINYKFKQKAVFGEATYKFDNGLKLTAGGRYYDFNEKRTFKSGGIFSNSDSFTDFNAPNNRTKSDGFTPRFIASYEASRDFSINLQAAKGFRLGGVNDPLNANLCTAQDRAIFGGYQRYDDETLWNYEANVKARGNGFTFNGGVFYNDIKNLQVTLDAGSCSSRVVFNVPKAHSVGVEFELTASPMEGLDLGISGTILEAKLDSTVVDGTGAVIGGIRKGNRLPTVPNFQISLNATYTAQLTASTKGVFNASFQHVGNRYTQPSDQENNPRSFRSGLAFGGATGTNPTVVDLLLPSYNLVNLSATAEYAGDVSATLYVTNLFDTNPLLSFDRERGGRARLGFNVGQPRVIGLTVRKKF